MNVASFEPCLPPFQEIVVNHTKFHVGESVRFTSDTLGRSRTAGDYTVVRVLPLESGEQRYRTKGIGEVHERVAQESQLERRG
jgi:hypothetical protein